MSRARVIEAGADVWERLRSKKIFLTGGTGFFGRSFLDLMSVVNEDFKLGLKVTILTRNAERFRKQWAQSFDFSMLRFLEGDITSFEFPNERFDHVLHFATPASATLNLEQPLEMFNVILDGSRRVLDFSREAKVQSILFTSSGAVYGKQPSEITHIPESYIGAPPTSLPSSAYGEAKRAAELLGNIYSKAYGFEHKIARCFAFVGPHLDKEGTFAIGNFLRDAQTKGIIEIKGDGTPYRSYMYSDDLILWLLKILLDGENGRPYNVGSDQDLSLERLASVVFEALGLHGKVSILGTPKVGALPERYVPSIELAKNELGLRLWTSLDEAIRNFAGGQS